MKSPRIMYFYAIFLAACGFLAFALSGFEARAATALVTGGGSAALMALCGLGASMIDKNKPIAMIGIHVGLILPLVFAGVFLWRAMEAYVGYVVGEPPLEALVTEYNLEAPEGEEIDSRPLYLPVLLGVMAIGSGFACGAILMTRPAPEKRE